MDGSQNSAEPGPSQRPRRLRVNQQQILNIFDQIDSDISDTDLLDSDEEQDDYDPRPNAGTAAGRTKVWKKKKFDIAYKSTAPSLPVPGHDEPINYFTEYLTEDFFEITANQTNLYSVQKTGKSIDTNVVEMKKFFGIHVAMEVFNLLRYRMYWGTRTRIPLIADTMNFNRFSRLRSFVHLVDNTSKDPDNLDRLWKVRPIIDIVQKKTQTISPSEHLSCDEQMVPFTGNLDIKQYIRGKPCPWGIKIFVLCNADGRVLSFEIYQGKKTNMVEEYKSFGLGACMVLNLAGRHQLALYEATGFRELGWKGRGSFCEVVASSGDTCLMKWMDNRSVILASNMIGSGAVNKVRRWCKQTKAYLQVDQPQVVSLYNQYMEEDRNCFKEFHIKK
ncbi:hypothetical protein QYM36_013836 [Artemia franciscana]|uniref:PiggyBac transposable element-derived protein domain-containing protein n=1 Tax=Artemia franciscana TaxID=6661 RepID=A0AA88HMD2_ARTSF|nr:hypothetical protein QYM36_013836 [Artemia franciscana]